MADARFGRRIHRWLSSSASLLAPRRMLKAIGGPSDLKARSSPVDLRNITTDPIEALYLVGQRPFIITVGLHRCRTFGLALDASNPMVRTLRDYGAGKLATADASPLGEYYRRWQPRTIAEALGLDESSVHPLLAEDAGGGLVLPWANSTVIGDAASRLTRKEFMAAARAAGVYAQGSAGILYYGPVGDAFLRATLERLKALYDSIREHGFRSELSKDHPRGRLLIEGDDWRVQLNSGKHRAAAMAALGHEEFPVQFGPGCAVRAAEVDAWPNVKNGTFSRQQALAVFGRHFRGDPPCPSPA